LSHHSRLTRQPTSWQNKAAAQAYLGLDELEPQYTLLSAATAGAAASFLTNPLDLIKLRLQVQRAVTAAAGNAGSSPLPYRGVVDGLAYVIRCAVLTLPNLVVRLRS